MTHLSSVQSGFQLPLVLLAARVTALFFRACVRRRIEQVTGTGVARVRLRPAVEG